MTMKKLRPFVDMEDEELINYHEELRAKLEKATNGKLDMVILNLLDIERELTLRESQ